jgi:hypothetical protein
MGSDLLTPAMRFHRAESIRHEGSTGWIGMR